MEARDVTALGVVMQVAATLAGGLTFALTGNQDGSIDRGETMVLAAWAAGYGIALAVTLAGLVLERRSS